MQLDTFSALLVRVEHLDNRFPDGNDIFQRISRLTEETGELAKVVNHREGMGVKVQKHGQSDDDQLIGEIRDVLGCALAIAHHYGVTDRLKETIHHEHDRIKYT